MTIARSLGWVVRRSIVMNIKTLACFVGALALPLAMTGCSKLAGAGGGCDYKAKAGFCITPPKGTTPKEESADKVLFEYPSTQKPQPAQIVVVTVEHSALDASRLKLEHGYARGTDPKGPPPLEDVALADGKGFYVLQNGTANLWAHASVPGPNNTFFQCSSSVYAKDKAALKDVLDACKTLTAQ